MDIIVDIKIKLQDKNMKKLEKARMIKEKRELMNINIEEIAHDLGIEISRYESFESGKNMIPSNDLKKIADYLDIDPRQCDLDILRKRKPVTTFNSMFRYDKHIEKNAIPKNRLLAKYTLKSVLAIKDKKNIDVLEAQLFHPETLKDAHPKLFMLVFLAFIFVAGLSFLISDYVLTNFIISITIPLTLLFLLLEFDRSRSLKGYKILIYFLVGGLLSIGLTYTFRSFTGYPNILFFEDLLTAVIEESAKFIIVLFIIKRLRIEHVYQGLLIGFAVGAGFDAFETSSYGLSTLMETGSSIEMYLNLLMRSGLAIIGIGHHFWTAMIAGAFISLQTHDKMYIKHLLNPHFITFFFSVVMLHALWNFSSNDVFWFIGPFVLLISLFMFIRFTKVQYCNDYILNQAIDEVIHLPEISLMSEEAQ